MFEDNWYLFLLIVMLAFFADGEISTKEAFVMISILLALTFTNNLEEDEEEEEEDTTTASGCFCNKNI